MFNESNSQQILRHDASVTTVCIHKIKILNTSKIFQAEITDLVANEEYQILVTAFDIQNHYKKSEYLRFRTRGIRKLFKISPS